MPLRGTQRIRATTDLEAANMARSLLILTQDRLSIAQLCVCTVKPHAFRTFSYKDIHI